jgi:hypothetical protein
MPGASEYAICMPETVIDEFTLEITDRLGDTPIHGLLGEVRRNANCQILGIPSIGLDELTQ